MPARFLLSLFLLFCLAGTAFAQLAADMPHRGSVSDKSPAAAAAPAVHPDSLYYVVRNQATVYFEPDGAMPFSRVRLREQVRLLGEKRGWMQIRRTDGTEGYVQPDVISNVWIRISKSDMMLYVYQGTRLAMKMPADFGFNVNGDKERQGSKLAPEHWRTPEGIFFICRKNPHSEFYKAFVLNYPTPEHAARGLRQGLISRSQYQEIVRAADTFSVPPMNTALGGMIEIHGFGTGGRGNWTKGCIALRDAHMDDLWAWVQVGTPVLIEP